MRFNGGMIGDHKLDWITQINVFIQKVKSSLPFYHFLYDTLDFSNKSDSDRWRSFSQSLTGWNDKYLDNYEKIILYSPVMWNLNATVNTYRISDYINLDNKYCVENWLYWVFLSSYMNYYVLNNLIVRKKENQICPWEYFLNANENTGMKVEEFLCNSDLESLFEKEYIWIDKKIFIQELAQKREKSYRRLIGQSSVNNAMDKEYMAARLSMYRKYEDYEVLFQSIDTDRTELKVMEMNPQGMNDLFDDCMCYFVKTEDRVYTLYFEDYS